MILRLLRLALAAGLFVLVYLAPLASAAPSDVSPETPITEILKLASTAQTSGAIQDALAYYEIALTRDPKNYLSFFKRGAYYLSLGRSQQALADFDKVLTIRPGFEGALTQRAKLRARSGDFKAARNDYLSAKKDASSEEIVNLDAAIHGAQQAKEAAKHRNWEECVTFASQAIMVAVGAPELRQLRVRCRLEKGDMQEALSDLSAVAQLNPGAVEAPLQISTMYFYALAETDRGLDAVRKCLHSDPDNKRCSALYRSQKSISKSLKKVRELMDKRSFSSVAKQLTSTDEENLGLVETVKEDMRFYRREGVIHPKAPELLLSQLLDMACTAYISMNSFKRGQPYCTDLLAHDPNALPGLVHKAQAQLDADDFEAAIRTLNTAREHMPQGHTLGNSVNELHQKAQTLLKRSKTKDYYKVLEISRDASDKEIKKAYRNLSKEHHPDKVTSPEARGAAEKKMAAINEAYEVLKDPELKARFDAGDDPNDPTGGHGGQPGGNPFGGHPFGGPMGGNPFGGGGGQRQQFVFRSGPGGPGGGAGGMPFGGGFQFPFQFG